MLNATTAPTGTTRGGAPGARGGATRMRRPGATSRGGITKRTGGRGARVDRDGDLDMDAPARPPGHQPRGGLSTTGGPSRGDMRGARPTRASGSGALRGGSSRVHGRGPGLVEITVLGWQESRGNRDSVIDFLERKSNVKIKKSRTQGDSLIISVPFIQVGEVTKWDNCNFAGSKLSIIAQNAPRIPSQTDEDVIMAANPRLAEKSETIKVLEQVLSNRYNPATKMLDLSRLGEDTTLRQNGFFELASTTSKMFPALMLVADRKFESASDKRDAVASVSLGYNNLKDTRAVSSLAATFPELKNLSLEGNMIPTWKDLDNWRHKFRKLEQLVMSGNSIVTTEGYREEAMRRYPLLQMLDNVLLDRPVIKIGAPTAIPPGINPVPRNKTQSAVGAQLPLSTKPGLNSDESGMAMHFLSNFFSMYDNNRDDVLATFYDESSKFSLQANTNAPRTHQHGVVLPPKPWEPYYPASRNLTRVYGAQLINKLCIGTQKIRELWAGLPRTKHDMSDSNLWVFDIYPIQGLPDPNSPLNYDGVNGVVATVHGEYEEVSGGGGVPLKRSFDRVFTLGPGKAPMELRVLNDMMVVRAWGGSGAWVPAPGSQDFLQQQMIAEVRVRTGLNLAYAELCLTENLWDFNNAIQAFERAKANGNLPPGAFV